MIAKMGRASRPAGCSAAGGVAENHGMHNTRETSEAKWFATDHAVAERPRRDQIHGAYGYSDEYPVERTCATRGARSSPRAPRSSTR